MLNPCRQIVRAIRYWFFPDSEEIDRRTEEIDHQRKLFKQRITETRTIVNSANQPDTLRNLVIAMTADKQRCPDDS